MVIEVESLEEVVAGWQSPVEVVSVVVLLEGDDLDDVVTAGDVLRQMDDMTQHDGLRQTWADAAALRCWLHMDEVEMVMVVHAEWKEVANLHPTVVASRHDAGIWPSWDFRPIRDVALGLGFSKTLLSHDVVHPGVEVLEKDAKG